MFFFFNDTATTEIYTLSLHDALPIYLVPAGRTRSYDGEVHPTGPRLCRYLHFNCPVCGSKLDRKSTRLNSSHANISYAVFCLKKKTRQRLNLSLTETPPHTLAIPLLI